MQDMMWTSIRNITKVKVKRSTPTLILTTSGRFLSIMFLTFPILTSLTILAILISLNILPILINLATRLGLTDVTANSNGITDMISGINQEYK